MDTCPFCGSDEILPRNPCGCVFWSCGSRQNKGKPAEESKTCLRRQIAQANETIRRLAGEEATDGPS